MSKEAMKLALVAMNECLFDDEWYDAKKALEEALAKQEQGEPVAKVINGKAHFFDEDVLPDETILYTTLRKE